MNFPILIQGLGCTETGARIVLRELLGAAPSGRPYWVLCTTETAKDFIGRPWGRFSKDVYVVGLSHRLFGRWLRPLVELAIGLMVITRLVKAVVNLSHYGLCFGGPYTLYVHSPLLMDVSTDTGWGEGRPNRLKRWMLNSCIRRAQLVVLQTQGMRLQLMAYCEYLGLPLPKHQVVRPKVCVEAGHWTARRLYPFQLFYPASRFVHKRSDLAIASGHLAHAWDSNIGLVLTTTPLADEQENERGVCQLGRISREAVYEWFAGSDALLFTSERETLGLPLLEALEFGVPVIAPRLPYAEEILGQAGCYFDQPTADAVMEAIICCRREYGSWREKIQSRAIEVRRDAATWSDHWQILLRTP